MKIAIVIILVLCGVICWLLVDKLQRREVDGLLNVDMRDPDKDYYDFVFLIPTGEIPKKKFLRIEVKTKS